MSNKNYPSQVIKRSLLLHKVCMKDLENNVQYKKAMNSIFRNPETYFSNYVNNHEVVIGKKTEILPISNCLSGSLTTTNKQNPRQNPYQFLLSQVKGLKRSNSNKNILLNSSNISNKHNISNTKDLPSNQRFIDDIEIKKIFDDFRSLRKKNITLKPSSSVHNMLHDTAFNNIKLSVENILTSQENSLTLHKQITQQNKHFINKLSKKIKQHPSDLNINHSRNYRMKKEIVNDLQEEVNIQNDVFGNFEWELSLRNDPNVKEKKYINYGSVKSPCWYPIIVSPKMNREIIRNPKERGGRGKKEIDELLEDEYRKERIGNKTLQEYKMSPKAAFMEDLQVKGKDLLTFEQENLKLIKGKKILNVNNDTKFNQDTRNNFVISRNWSLPVLRKYKSFSGE